MENYLDYNEDGQSTFKTESYIQKALKLIDSKEFKKALDLINSKNDEYFERYNLKGVILTNLSNFSEAVESFDAALSLNNSDEIKLNMADSLYRWAKYTFFPEMNYFKAINLINQALEILPESEDASEYYFLKAEILEAQNDLIESQKCYLIAHGEFEKLKEFEHQIEYLNNTEDTLFIITGTNFYSDFTPEKGLTVNLVKEIGSTILPSL